MKHVMDISKVQLNTLLAAIFKDGDRLYKDWLNDGEHSPAYHKSVPDQIFLFIVMVYKIIKGKYLIKGEFLIGFIFKSQKMWK